LRGPQLNKDNGEIISDEEWNKGIECLIKNIPKNEFSELQDKLKNQKDFSLDSLHHTFGTYIRNLIRKNNFSWGAISLDSNWESLLEDTMEKNG
jgi:hypothetical protein